MPEIEQDWIWVNTQPLGIEEGAERLALAKAVSRCFGGEDGALVLNYLKALTLDRALGAQASAETLRHLEGQRQLVLHIITLINRGSFPL